nr:hypothetical protein [Clostridiales bacterium]
MSNTQYDDELFDEIDEFDDYEELGGGAGFEEEHERDTVRSTGFRIAAVVMFLISIGGLFLGLISKWVSFLTPVASAGTDGALNNSLMGILIEVFKGLFSDSGIQPVKTFSFKEGLPVLLSAVQYYFYFVFLACLILSLMLTIISLTPERIHEGKERASRAERCAYGIALLNVFGFGGIFLIQMFTASSLVHYVRPMVVDTIDFSSLIIAIVAVVFLLLIALSGAKKREET